MQLSTFLVLLVGTAGVSADVHKYATCHSRIQPLNNPNTCPKKRDVDVNPNDEGLVRLARSRIESRAYADNAAATKKACAAYRARNTGNKQWDKCPDCTYAIRHTEDPSTCVWACNSAGSHIGGDEWLYYCKQAGADAAEAY